MPIALLMDKERREREEILVNNKISPCPFAVLNSVNRIEGILCMAKGVPAPEAKIISHSVWKMAAISGINKTYFFINQQWYCPRMHFIRGNLFHSLSLQRYYFPSVPK